MQQLLKREEMLTVKQIWKELNKTISIRQIYNLIERGDLSPAYRFAGSRGTCVPRTAVAAYKRRCVVEVGN